jgi:hypothetical protein
VLRQQMEGPPSSHAVCGRVRELLERALSLSVKSQGWEFAGIQAHRGPRPGGGRAGGRPPAPGGRSAVGARGGGPAPAGRGPAGWGPTGNGWAAGRSRNPTGGTGRSWILWSS